MHWQKITPQYINRLFSAVRVGLFSVLLGVRLRMCLVESALKMPLFIKYRCITFRKTIVKKMVQIGLLWQHQSHKHFYCLLLLISQPFILILLLKTCGKHDTQTPANQCSLLYMIKDVSLTKGQQLPSVPLLTWSWSCPSVLPDSSPGRAW